MDIREQLEQLNDELSKANNPEELSRIEFKIQKLKMQQEMMDLEVNASEKKEASNNSDIGSEAVQSATDPVTVSDLVRKYGLGEKEKIISEIKEYTGLSIQDASHVYDMYIDKGIDGDLITRHNPVNSEDGNGELISQVTTIPESYNTYSDSLDSMVSGNDRKTAKPKRRRNSPLRILILLTILIGLSIYALDSYGFFNPSPDYPDEASFENALNRGADPAGKTVKITVEKLAPDSAFGYNIQTGKHLNFCSVSHPKVKKGDTIIVEVVDVNSVLGSYIIEYEKINEFEVFLHNIKEQLSFI